LIQLVVNCQLLNYPSLVAATAARGEQGDERAEAGALLVAWWRDGPLAPQQRPRLGRNGLPIGQVDLGHGWAEISVGKALFPLASQGLICHNCTRSCICSCT